MRTNKGYVFRACEGVSRRGLCSAGTHTHAGVGRLHGGNGGGRRGRLDAVGLGGCRQDSGPWARYGAGGGSTLGFLWLVLDGKQGQKLGKLSGGN